MWGRAMGQTRLAGARAGVCKSAHVLQPPLLQRKQENRAAKTHPLQQPEPLAEEKTRRGETQILGVISPGQGHPTLVRRKLQNSILAFAPHEPAPTRNLYCLILAGVRATAFPTTSEEASPWELLPSHLVLEVTIALPRSLPRAFYF